MEHELPRGPDVVADRRGRASEPSHEVVALLRAQALLRSDSLVGRVGVPVGARGS